MQKSERVNFGSKIGAILAAAGSAVGLGNIWRFPYETGNPVSYTHLNHSKHEAEKANKIVKGIFIALIVLALITICLLYTSCPRNMIKLNCKICSNSSLRNETYLPRCV